jgi:Zn-dependent protease
MYDEYGNLVIPKNFGRIQFGRKELIQIMISVAVLTVAFTIVLLGGLLGDVSSYTPMALLFALGISAVVSITGFLLHELAHKFVAQRFGAWAEYRMYPSGLLMALVFSFLGFLFAAPGAVYIQGRITKKQNGLISVAGPATNIAFGSVFIILWLAFPDMGAWTFAFNLIGVLSLFLAGFNLIPFGPLDGKKVLDWSPVVWISTVGVAAVMLMIGWGIIG